MAVVTLRRYRDITGDRITDDAAVTARLEEAQDLIEDELGRLLESAERTETLTLTFEHGSWRAYPQAFPITAVGAGETFTIEDDVTLANVTIDDTAFWGTAVPVEGTVTYTGGYTTSTVPKALERGIAQLAHALCPALVGAGAPSGASSVHVGDVSVTFARPSGAGEIDALVPGLTARLRPYRRPRRFAS
jgi:hypothetical protein